MNFWVAIERQDTTWTRSQRYRTMFSLNDETLEAGGDSILASNGELGQLLFSASAGLAELSKVLMDLRARTDGFT